MGSCDNSWIELYAMLRVVGAGAVAMLLIAAGVVVLMMKIAKR